MPAKEPELFTTKVVKAKEGSGKLFEDVFEKTEGPVTCLGMTFDNDDARRDYFTEQLREKLKDPEFRKIEGFPIGEDEDILALSDPPYYTACPNPWLNDFIDEWEAQKPAIKKNYKYHREPFTTNVSEGKNDPIYNAHPYHTKVPHKAIMRYILHYTEPGDIVFDGFCGTGMTGIAAQMCSDREVVMSLGYQVKPDGTVLQKEVDKDGKPVWQAFSKLGLRRAALNDLSPVATFISHNYNTPIDVEAFKKEVQLILKEVEDECGWMYETCHTDGETKGKINYTIWSDVFICPECVEEIIFWENALDFNKGKVKKEFSCPHCNSILNKRNMKRAWTSIFDHGIKETIKQAKLVPVLINYSVGTKRYEKKPDQVDLSTIKKTEEMKIQYDYSTQKLQDGLNTRQPLISHGLSNVHHFYTKRNLYNLALWNVKIRGHKFESQLKFVFTSAHQYLNKLCRLHVGNHFTKKGGTVDKPLGNTLYMPSISLEVNVQSRIALRSRLNKSLMARSRNAISTMTSTESFMPPESADYIFIDPPFGANINYSEVNVLWEGWLGVKTNNKDEAIVNDVQKKDLNAYRILMKESFEHAYKLLKPGRWMTIEFSNTKAAVWNCIQTAITEAGFIVANVSALDKKKGSHKAVTTPTAVKQDLVISAYKPNGGFEKRFITEADSEEGVWDFIRTHLNYLPVIKRQNLEIINIPERDPRILFDQVVAYYIRKGFNIPISSKDFQVGLEQRFPERDGMYFLPEQVAEYDKNKMVGSSKYKQIEIYVSDESSAIDWLRRLLNEKPQTTQDIHPQFIQETQRTWKKSEMPVELSILLDQNFLCYDGKGPVPAQIHSYLSSNYKGLRKLEKDDSELMAKAKNRWYVPNPNEAADREKVREKSLLKDFEQYRQATKKLKVFRIEAMRAGFKKAYQEKDYQTIIDIAQKIQGGLLEEDPKLLMWYDQAITRTEG